MLKMHVFLHYFSHVWAVFGKNPAKRAKNRPKKCQNPAKTCIFVPFGAVHGFSRLVPDGFPTGSRLVPDFQKVVLEFAESGVKFWPKFAELDDFLGFGKCFGGFGAGGGSLGVFGGFGGGWRGVWGFWASFW